VTNSAGTSTTQVFTGQTVIRNGGPNATTQQAITISNITPPTQLLLPPTHFHGVQKINRFATQSEYVNILTWQTPSSGIIPVAYHIYKDPQLTHLIAVIPADRKLRYEAHNRKKGKGYSYTIVSVDQFGNFSVPITVIINK
jgi:hypothetical protein